ncbi:hypothetical protein SEVIR_7G004100v4 [Setaria viridis]|uniref:FBD domain-containing protein n=1 Tax=Setaria viridis TaxID=4556 RepID=A0A4U6TKT8_SETVI|nr:hypothetical protein SEVIR_7G004100v2 [Setaria viridis]
MHPCFYARIAGPSFLHHRWYRVERCPKLQAVFVSYHGDWGSYKFEYLENIWASDLLAAKCIWAKGIIFDSKRSFEALQIRIQLYNCPRLRFVLPYQASSFPAWRPGLHIARCGDLKQVFLWDVGTHQYREEGIVKEFPKLKHIQLHELPSLEEICEAKMSVPILESIKVRGC